MRTKLLHNRCLLHAMDVVTIFSIKQWVSMGRGCKSHVYKGALSPSAPCKWHRRAVAAILSQRVVVLGPDPRLECAVHFPAPCHHPVRYCLLGIPADRMDLIQVSGCTLLHAFTYDHFFSFAFKIAHGEAHLRVFLRLCSTPAYLLSTCLGVELSWQPQAIICLGL